jgi:DNA-directed RNA polymerase subunit F
MFRLPWRSGTKKVFVTAISILVGLSLLGGLSSCSKEEKKNEIKDVITDVKNLDVGKDAEIVNDALELMGKMNQWPKEELPEAVPELTKGKVVNWGKDNGEVIVKMEEVTIETLEEYRSQLEAKGWRVDGDADKEMSATLDLYNLSIKYSKNGSVQLWLVEYEEVGWPGDLLPKDFPKFEKGMVGNAYKDDELKLVYIGIEGATLEDALEYEKLLKSKGWEGEEPTLGEDNNSFNVQLSKDEYFLDFDYYYMADGFTLQLMKN